jgi:GTP-sensing pleiotropic transcriptional regulator CodY
MAKNRKVFKRTEESKKGEFSLLNILEEITAIQKRTLEKMLEYEEIFKSLNNVLNLNEMIIRKQNEAIRMLNEEVKELKQSINKGGKNG